MKKKSKRILSILLTIILVLTMMSAGVPTVSAETSGDYTNVANLQIHGNGYFIDTNSAYDNKVSFSIEAIETVNGLNINMKVTDPLYFDGPQIVFNFNTTTKNYNVYTSEDGTNVDFTASATIQIGDDAPFVTDVTITVVDGETDAFGISFNDADWGLNNIAGGSIVIEYTIPKVSSTGGTSTGGTSSSGTSSTVTSSAVSNSTGNNSTGGKSTEFSLQDDAYKFSNTGANFKSSFAISKQYVSLLEKGMSNKVKEQIDQYEANSWNGSCLGMSASLISFFNQNLSPVKWDSNDNAKNVYGLATPVTDDKVNDLINFYQLMALLPDNVEMPKVSSNLEAFEDLVTYTKNIASGGPLVQFTFELKANKDSKDYMHTVVAYGITEFSTHYDILIADPDKEIAFFSVSKDFTTPKIVANPGETVPYSFISAISVINDPKEISLINPQTGASYVKKHDYTAPWLIILKDLGSLILSNLSGQSDTIVNGAVSGNLPIGNVKQISGGSDEGNEPFETFYELPKEDAYNINLDNPADINLSICYVDTLEGVKSSAAQSVSFSPTDGIGLASEAGKPFELSMTFNNSTSTVPWSTVTVAGNAAATTSMEKTSEGIVVKGDGLSGLKVTGQLNGNQTTVNIPPSEDKFLIKETAPGKTDMGIYLDSNNDGTYEKLAQTGNAIQTSSNTFAPSMLLVAVALVVVAVLLMLLMLLFLRKKRKHTPKFAVVNDYSPSAPVKHEYPKTNDEVRSAAPSAFKKADFSNEDDAKSTMKTTEKPIDSKEKLKKKEGNKYYSKPDDLD